MAWNRLDPVPLYSSQLNYTVSFDGGVVFGPPRDFSAGLSADPMVAVSPVSGDMWVGGVAGAGLTVWHKPRNGPVNETPHTIVSGSMLDKPFMAVGPQPQGFLPPPAFDETMYVAYRKGFSADMMAIKSTDSAVTGTVWNEPARQITSDAGALRHGSGEYPVVFENGRLGVAASNKQWLDPPEWTYHNKGADPAQGNWQSYWPLNRFGPPNQEVQIFGVNSTDAAPGGLWGMSTFPSVAIDPLQPNIVYIIFAGRASDSDPNTDIFVARSFDSGTNFFYSDIIRLTDAKFLEPGETPVASSEYLPSGAFDEYGGFNLLVSRLVNAANGQRATIRYLRFKNADFTRPPFVKNLTPTAEGGFTPWYSTAGNEYHMLKASGCYVYLAYAANLSFTVGQPDPQPIPPTWNIYFRRVKVGECMLDLIPNQVLGQEDIDAFEEAFVLGLVTADLNGDGFVDSQDRDVFYESYIEGREIKS